jgi:hypothetical protein
MAGVLVVVAIVVRFVRPGDVFWRWWLPVTSVVVAGVSIGSLGGLELFGSVSWAEAASTITVGLAALTVALGRGDVGVRSSVVIVLVAVGVVPYVDVGWTGLVGVAASIVITEWLARIDDRHDGAIWLPTGLAAVGLGLTFYEPWAAIAGFGAASLWTHWRRLTGLPIRDGAEIMALAASIVPIGLGWGLWQVMEPAEALLVMAGVLVVVALAVRVFRSVDLFWRWWPSAAAIVVGGLAVDLIGIVPAAGFSRAASSSLIAMALVAATIGLGPRNAVARTWAVTAVVAVGFYLYLEMAAATPTLRAIAWSGIGLTVVVAGLFHRSTALDHPPAIGHIVGAGAVALAFGQTGRAVALTAWTLGLVVAVTAQRLDRGSLPRMLIRLATAVGTIPRTLAAWTVPVLLAASVPVAALVSLNLWDTFVANRSWTGLVVGAVAVVYAIAVRMMPLDLPLQRSLTIAASVLVVIGVAVAAPVIWPTIAATAMSIVVALLLAPSVRGAALSWFAWLMSGVMLTLLGERAGLDEKGLRLLVLGLAVGYFGGGLIVDDITAGRRGRGEGLRNAWTRFPVLLGAVAVPASLGVIMALEPDVAPWSALGAAAGYFGVAWLLRSSLVTVPAYALATFGVVTLLPASPVEEPLLMPGAVAALLAISLAIHVYRGSASSVWDGWDLPPLLVAHAAAVFALVVSAPDADPRPWLLIGVMSGLVGVWRGSRYWIDAGHVLVLVAASLVGTGAIAAALALTSLRAMYETSRVEGGVRLAGHIVAIGSAVAAWVLTIEWARWTVDGTTSLTGLAFGVGALLVALLHHHRWIDRDTAVAWLATASLGTGYAMVMALITGPADGSTLLTVGPSVGLVALSAAVHIARDSIEKIPSYFPVAIAGAAWVTLLVFSGWDPIDGVIATSLLGGVIAAGVAEWARRTGGRQPDLVSAWGVLGVAFVAGSILVGLGLESRDVWTAGLAPATGLLSLGAGRAAGSLPVRFLRDVALLGVLAALAMLVHGLEQDALFLVTAVLVLSVLASVVLVVLGARNLPATAWARPLALFVVAASLLAAVLALTLLPDGPPITGVLLVIGVEATLIGMAWRHGLVLAIAPLALGAASILLIAESAVGVVQWYTLPLAIVMLAEIEIVRTFPIGRVEDAPAPNVVWAEWFAIGLGVLPAVVDTFARSLASSFIAFGFALGLFLWALLTRLRRRAVAAAAVGAASAVLVIAAALAGSAPDSSSFWIIAVGLGFAVMSVAGVIEAARSRRGFAVRRIDELMGDWE